MADQYRAVRVLFRWHVARCLPGCMPLGIMDCPSEAVAAREAAILNGHRYAPRRLENLDRIEMCSGEEDMEIQRELHEDYGMPRDPSPFAQLEIAF